MRYSVTVLARSLMPARGGRPLVPEPRGHATLAQARGWVWRNAATWCSALLPTEEGFSAFVLDEDGSEALTLEYGRDPDAQPVEHDRESLREMKAARPKTKTTTTTNEARRK